MPRRIQAVKGTRDLLPPESARWSGVERTAREVFSAYGYQEIRTPILEATDLFVRSVGETTDIVGKQMYTFADRKGRSLTLRPESTASVVRAFIQHGMVNRPLPAKLYYIGPHFRYERPQKGRYRQFHQIGAELIGDPGPEGDAELILMLLRFLSALDFEELVVQLNTVGDEASRRGYREALRTFFEPHRKELGEDSRRRLDDNPLRILDSKDPAEQRLLAEAPVLVDYLSPESLEHFEAVQRDLDRFNVAFRIEPWLVSSNKSLVSVERVALIEQILRFPGSSSSFTILTTMSTLPPGPVIRNACFGDSLLSHCRARSANSANHLCVSVSSGMV